MSPSSHALGPLCSSPRVTTTKQVFASRVDCADLLCAGANGTVYTLALQSVALSDEGTYRCQASKSDSSLPAVSREAIIVVICTRPLNAHFRSS